MTVEVLWQKTTTEKSAMWRVFDNVPEGSTIISYATCFPLKYIAAVSICIKNQLYPLSHYNTVSAWYW